MSGARYCANKFGFVVFSLPLRLGLIRQSARMSALSTDFVLSLLIVVILGLQGGMRVRGDVEQLLIFTHRTSGFGYPPKLMPMYGATQVASAVLALLLPDIGLPLVVTVAVVEACNHAIRQHNLPVTVFDAIPACLAFTIGILTNASLTYLILGIPGGITLFALLHSMFPPAHIRPTDKAK